MRTLYLFVCLLVILSFGLQAQPVVPGYRLFDSICLDENPDVRYLRDILEKAKEEEFKRQAENANESRLTVEISPQTDADKAQWKAARLLLQSSPEGWVGVFEIDLIHGDGVETVQVEKNRVVELIWKLKDILDQSERWGTEAIYLAECTPGHCYQQSRFIPIEKENQLPPASNSGNFDLRIQDPETQREVQWDISRSLLESHRRYTASEKPNPHQQKPKQCVHLACGNQFEELNTEDEDFQKLMKDYEFFVHHTELLIRQSLVPKR